MIENFKKKFLDRERLNQINMKTFKMKKNILLASICFAIFVTASAQWPSNVTVIDTNNDSIIVQGDLAKGSKMADLSWAWNSANACFPGTQSSKFKGNHVFYAK